MMKAARQTWRQIVGERGVLTDESTSQELEDEAEWIQNTTVTVLDTYCKRVRIVARSKRWWNESIQQRRKDLSAVKRRRRGGMASKKEVKEARRLMRKEIREAKRRTWEEFLEAAAGDNVWSVMNYTKPMREMTVPAIRCRRKHHPHT